MITLLLPYLKYAKFIVLGLAVSVAGLLLNHFINYERQLGYNKAISVYLEKSLEAEKKAREVETTLNAKLEEAQNAATQRAIKINDLAKSLNATSDGLRNTIASLRSQLSKDSPDASRKAADTSLSVLGECQKDYGDMAEKADRHASDVKLLQDAWPK